MPIWILIAVTYQDTWTCSFCGFSDAIKYLQNPRHREHEQIAVEPKRMMDQRRAEEKQKLLAAMPMDTVSDKTAYVWAAHKIPILAFGGTVLFIDFLVIMNVINSPRSSLANSAVPNKRSNVKPVFNAAVLAGKSPKEGEKILGLGFRIMRIVQIVRAFRILRSGVCFRGTL